MNIAGFYDQTCALPVAPVKKIVCFSADILFVDVNVEYLEVKCGSDDLHLLDCWAFIRCSAKLSNPRRLRKHAPSVEESGNCVTAMGVSILRWMSDRTQT